MSGLFRFHLRRDHQIEDPSKDRDKGDDAGRRNVPLWKVLPPDALRLPGHLRNPEQRAAEALNIYHTRAPASPLLDLSVLPQERRDTSWVLTTEDSRSWPSSGTSADAALRAVSGVTDGEMNSVDVLLSITASLFDPSLELPPFCPSPLAIFGPFATISLLMRPLFPFSTSFFLLPSLHTSIFWTVWRWNITVAVKNHISYGL